MIAPGMLSYDVVLQGKYFLRETIERLTLEERLDEVSCRATVDLVVPGEEKSGIDLSGGYVDVPAGWPAKP